MSYDRDGYDDGTPSNAELADPDPDFYRDIDDDLDEDEYHDVPEPDDNPDEGRPPLENTHAEDCPRHHDCVECGGCDCGLVPSTCEGPGCYSIDAARQDAEEYGSAGGVYGEEW